jgi:hypothetical protein
VDRVRTAFSEERIACIIREERISEVEATLPVTSELPVTSNVLSSRIVSTLMMEATSSSETSILTRSTWRHISGEMFPVRSLQKKTELPVVEIKPEATIR